MAYRTRTGTLLIADISGYTEYLAHAELEHAQAIITVLLESIIDAVDRRLELVKLEGDAVFFVSEQGPELGQTVVANVVSMFRAFHLRQQRARRETGCPCQGCACACGLGLKFVAHHGTFGEHDVHGLREIIGPDVVIVHRLLKNTVGLREYALFTAALVDQLGADAPGVRLEAHSESYEYIGVVPTGVWDLGPLCDGAHQHGAASESGPPQH